MKNAFKIFLVLFYYSSLAQISISKIDMPLPGDTIYMSSIANFNGINATTTGTSYTWDFSMLSSLQERKDSFISVNSTPFAYQLFFNNVFLYPENKSTVAIKSTAPPLPAQSPIQLGNVYNFYKAVTAEYAQTGFGAEINGLPASVRFDPALDMDILYKFPLTYGNQADSCHSFFELNVPNLAYFSEDRKRKNVVDGWGTLELPNRSYAVLRVKSTSVISDSIFVSQFGFGFRLPSRTEVEYKWMGAGKKEPLLLLVTGANNTITRGEFQNEQPLSSVSEFTSDNKNSNGVTIFPNPAKNLINFSLSEKQKVQKIYIYNEAGECVMERNDSIDLDISGLSPGFYVLKVLCSNNEITSGKFVKY